MRIYLYVYQNQMDIFHRILKNPWQDYDKISLFKDKKEFGSSNMIMISLDYDTYINLLDQNKIEIL